jgi:hypothetical protein
MVNGIEVVGAFETVLFNLDSEIKRNKQGKRNHVIEHKNIQ